MSEIREYKCTYSNSVGISAEVTDGLGLEFPDAYMHSDTMQTLAKAIKAHDRADFCLLPFCRMCRPESPEDRPTYRNSSDTSIFSSNQFLASSGLTWEVDGFAPSFSML